MFRQNTETFRSVRESTCLLQTDKIGSKLIVIFTFSIRGISIKENSGLGIVIHLHDSNIGTFS